MAISPELPVLAFESADALARWLAANQATSSGIFLKLAKKGSGVASVSYPEAVDLGLCFGWIDGQSKSIDETYWRIRYTPRRSKSIWSKKNRARVAELIAAGRMQPAGLREVEAAQRDGRWDAAYDSPSTFTVPADFQAALENNPAAKTFFATLNRSNQYGICTQIQFAKREQTRQARIERFVTMLTRGEKLYP